MAIAKHQPSWVCNDCGRKYGAWFQGNYSGPLGHLSTYHEGVCDVCQQTAEVTEARDYGYLAEGWQPSFNFAEFA